MCAHVHLDQARFIQALLLRPSQRPPHCATLACIDNQAETHPPCANQSLAPMQTGFC